MRFRMDQLLRSLSMGLDSVESELTGSTSHHGKRVAVLTAAMGRQLGWNDEQIITVTACGLLHDNALTESLAETRQEPGGGHPGLLAAHCAKGEKNASHLPFPSDARDVIAYHHEYMDGSGPFGLDAAETPLGAQLIALADHFDIHRRVKECAPSALEDLRDALRRDGGSYYTPSAAEAMQGALDADLLLSLQDENIDRAYAQAIPAWRTDLDAEGMMAIAQTVAAITDYKSAFTAKHSLQIANRAYWMARFYGFDEETRAKIYLAAALHDVGKLMTPLAVLEKPGKLDPQEYRIIQQHVAWSYAMLRDVDGLDEICRWAVTHHRKLTGKGYPNLPDAYLEMDFVSRMMACIDIYQAVRETRPYHPARTHQETMAILWDMAEHGEIDRQIADDLDREMAGFPGADGDVPSPLCG